MNWPGFYSLSSAWLFLLLIPLLVFYFLKLKRPRQEVPSLALWQQVINDQRVNSPFQKFKRNILLMLQLLLLMLLILAAMQPFLSSGAERAEYLPVLVDCSASMGAVDGDGMSRIDAAKLEIDKLIDDMLPDQRMSLIAVSSSARRLTEFTDNKRLLRNALDKLTVVDVPAELEDALRMTQALARTVPIDSVLVYSDGNLPGQVDFELPFDLNFQQLKKGGYNIGVTEFNARRSKTSWDVFVRVEASDQRDGEAEVMLLQDGEEIGRETVFLEPGASQRLNFSVATEDATSLELRLKPDGKDSLKTDNSAFLEVPVARDLEVFCSPALTSWRHAFDVAESISLSEPSTSSPKLANYDVLVTSAVEDLEANSAVTIAVGIVPADLEKLLTVNEEEAGEVVDWQRADPLLQYVNFGAVKLGVRPESAKGVADADYEERGYQIIAVGDAGPLVLKKRIGAKLTYFFLFHTDVSTLPYNLGFPIVVANSTQIALQQASLSEIRGQATGVLPAQKVSPNSEFTVLSPDGSTRTYESDDNGQLQGIGAPIVGRYKISGDNGSSIVGAGLLNQMETSLVATESIQFRELSVSAADGVIENDRPLWPILAAIAFVVLLVEWWFFQKRPSGVPA